MKARLTGHRAPLHCVPRPPSLPAKETLLFTLAEEAGLPCTSVLCLGQEPCPMAGQYSLSQKTPGVSLTKTTSQSAARAHIFLIILMHLEIQVDIVMVEIWVRAGAGGQPYAGVPLATMYFSVYMWSSVQSL